ncbi:ELL-associated factor [Pelomyxa schiedti]|nr:ELL-associated factor [Pelomyxa schiedti]
MGSYGTQTGFSNNNPGAGPPTPIQDVEYPVTLGSSFAQPSDLLSMHYTFWPTSADVNQPGIIERADDGHLRMQFQNTGADKESVILRGQWRAAKEGECVLIFDGQSFTLQRIAVVGEGVKHDRSEKPISEPSSKRSKNDVPFTKTKSVPLQPPQQVQQIPQQQSSFPKTTTYSTPPSITQQAQPQLQSTQQQQPTAYTRADTQPLPQSQPQPQPQPQVSTAVSILESDSSDWAESDEGSDDDEINGLQYAATQPQQPLQPLQQPVNMLQQPVPQIQTLPPFSSILNSNPGELNLPDSSSSDEFSSDEEE